MDEKKEEIARIIAFDLCSQRNAHRQLFGDKSMCYSDNNFAECTKIKSVVDKIYNAGYRKVDEYEAEIERLNRRIAELEQDLVHADENVFYREQNVKLCEEKLKSEARNEDEETKKLENGIIEIFIEMCGDEPPCNFNDYGDYMILNCGDYCDTNHDKHDYRKCWEIFIKSKLREYGVDVEE